MVRPRRCRRVWFEPNVTYFKPAGIRLAELGESILTVDEFEAVRLKDFQNLEQEEAAKKMNISQPTFHRLVLSARRKIADALVNGKAIKIQGGIYKMVQEKMKRFRCYECDFKWEIPYGGGRPDKCPKCDSTNIHRADSGPHRHRRAWD